MTTDWRREPADLAGRAERDYLTYASSFSRVPGITLVDDGELLARRGDLVHDYLTLVLGTWTSADRVDGLIERALGELGGPGRPFTWIVWPSNTPSTLRERLGAAGFRHLDDGPLMTFDLAGGTLVQEAPDGIVIERVTDPRRMREAADVVMPPGEGDLGARELFQRAYDALIQGPDPVMRYFVGRVDGRAVATAALYTGTGLAGIYAVGTAPDVRGRGYGRALTVAAMVEGRRLGYTTAALLSSELGLPVYRRIGFETIGTVSFFGSPA